MKAKDLMLNDLVLHDGVPKRVDMIWLHELSLHDFRKTWGSIYADKFHEDEISPLPLTADILERSGWRKEIANDIGENYVWFRGRIDIVTTLEMNEFCTNAIVFHYVHELQHLLRLLGVSDNILVI